MEPLEQIERLVKKHDGRDWEQDKYFVSKSLQYLTTTTFYVIIDPSGTVVTRRYPTNGHQVPIYQFVKSGNRTEYRKL